MRLGGVVWDRVGWCGARGVRLGVVRCNGEGLGGVLVGKGREAAAAAAARARAAK